MHTCTCVYIQMQGPCWELVSHLVQHTAHVELCVRVIAGALLHERLRVGGGGQVEELRDIDIMVWREVKGRGREGRCCRIDLYTLQLGRSSSAYLMAACSFTTCACARVHTQCTCTCMSHVHYNRHLKFNFKYWSFSTSARHYQAYNVCKSNKVHIN